MNDLKPISLNCREHQADPEQPRGACTGCGCACHDVPMPTSFRELVELSKTSSTAGDVVPVEGEPGLAGGAAAPTTDP